MAKNSYYEKDFGWNKLITRFETEAGSSSVFIGFLRSSGFHKPKAKKGVLPKGEPMTMAQLGAIHEFGTADGHIPERSYMRASLHANEKKIEKMITKLATQVLEEDMPKEKALGLVGEYVKNVFKAFIRKGVPPPNKPSTIAAKGSSKPLVDTGQLLNTIEWEVKTGDTLSKGTKK